MNVFLSSCLPVEDGIRTPRNIALDGGSCVAVLWRL
jgi:hypothetical protein